ncbi:MAG: hypothetical protein JWM41_3136 [Gemmatimonadetes bacterium]|nr:hypothetical protein [Gemmatimonadota bacterium]
MSSDAPNASRWARVFLTLLLARLAWSAFHDEYGVVPILSDIDLAVHEFGHVLFMPFGIPILGRTMVILGGSLFQIVFPLIFIAYFVRDRAGQRRDVHAAMVCLWWTSINLLDVAIYANDARAGVLMLVSGQTGQESDGHDWNNLFTIWGVLDKDTIIAARMRAVAVLLCVASIVIGLYAAWRSGDPVPAATADAEPAT